MPLTQAASLRLTTDTTDGCIFLLRRLQRSGNVETKEIWILPVLFLFFLKQRELFANH